MNKIEKLQQEVVEQKQALADLQSTVDAEQEQIAALLDAFEQTEIVLREQIAALEAQLADVGSPDQIQAVIDALEAARADIAATKADVESTVEDSTTSSTTESTTVAEETTTSSTTETSTEQEPF